MTFQLPPLDLHAHINPKIRPVELERLGAVVFAATRSIDEYASVKNRHDQTTIWGIGCHPSVVGAQREYDPTKFELLLKSTAFVSEIGMDRRSKVPLKEQERVFDSILQNLQAAPRIASIHSSGVPDQVLDALERQPIRGAVLHWWRGNEAQTRRAVKLGCWFSINSAGLKYPNDVASIPLKQIFTETDHPSGDRGSPAPIQPGAVLDVEEALERIYDIGVGVFRGQAWLNMVNLVEKVGVNDLLPTAVQRMIHFAQTSRKD